MRSLRELTSDSGRTWGAAFFEISILVSGADGRKRESHWLLAGQKPTKEAKEKKGAWAGGFGEHPEQRRASAMAGSDLELRPWSTVD